MHEREKSSPPNGNQGAEQAVDQRDASDGAANGLRKLLFMKSEESVTPNGWPNLNNQKAIAGSPSKIAHFQSSPEQPKTSKQGKQFKRKDLKELLVGPGQPKEN